MGLGGGHNALVVLGPTASGKTRLAVQLAEMLDGESLSADSRQVYRGLDIGSGKDLGEYGAVQHHLIDIAELPAEFSVFHFQRAFHAAFEEVRGRGKLPVIVSGTGLYLQAALDPMRMAEVPENAELRTELEALEAPALEARLHTLKPELHNVTDTRDRARMIRAIEIASHTRDTPPAPAPDIRPFILGTRWDRAVLRQRIATRLKERLGAGLIEEVERLHAQGVSWARLELLGLEYRFVAEFLQGRITNRNDLFQKLGAAIAQFAKRQETLFRRMERQGHAIHWVGEARLDTALAFLREAP